MFCCSLKETRPFTPMALAMRFSERMVFETEEGVNVTCPDGYVQYNLKRLKE